LEYDWKWDEFAAPGLDHADPAVVREYDRKHAKLGDPVEAARSMLHDLELPAGAVLADIGCGTGTLAIEAARDGCEVCAVDVSQAMLDHAAARAREAGVGGIRFMRAGFLSFELDRPADAIVTRAALHHLPDFWKMIAVQRCADALKPGGRFLLADVAYVDDPRRYREVLTTAMREFEKRVDPDFLADIHGDLRKEFMTLAWIIEGILERAGLEVVRTRRTGLFSAWLCRKP
jgi:SAM-dependent methyltransferase